MLIRDWFLAQIQKNCEAYSKANVQSDHPSKVWQANSSFPNRPSLHAWKKQTIEPS